MRILVLKKNSKAQLGTTAAWEKSLAVKLPVESYIHYCNITDFDYWMPFPPTPEEQNET
jgi:hypothetical protein